MIACVVPVSGENVVSKMSRFVRKAIPDTLSQGASTNWQSTLELQIHFTPWQTQDTPDQINQVRFSLANFCNGPLIKFCRKWLKVQSVKMRRWKAMHKAKDILYCLFRFSPVWVAEIMTAKTKSVVHVYFKLLISEDDSQILSSSKAGLYGAHPF